MVNGDRCVSSVAWSGVGMCREEASCACTSRSNLKRPPAAQIHINRSGFRASILSVAGRHRHRKKKKNKKRGRTGPICEFAGKGSNMSRMADSDGRWAKRRRTATRSAFVSKRGPRAYQTDTHKGWTHLKDQRRERRGWGYRYRRRRRGSEAHTKEPHAMRDECACAEVSNNQ